MQKLHKNTFTQGIDSDTTPENLSSSKYIDALGITVTSDSDYSAVRLRNPDKLKVTLPNNKLLKIINCRYRIGDTLVKPSLLLFTLYSGDNVNFFIRLYIHNETNTTILASYPIDTSNIPFGQTPKINVDAALFTENGVDNVYFTDGISEPKKIPLSKSIIDNGSGDIANDDQDLPQIEI